MSIKSLSPIVLPADPAAAMEAVTKQYVDARAGSEVEISATDPIGTNPTAELWYDSDAPDVLAMPAVVPRGQVGKVGWLASITDMPATTETAISNALAVTMATGRRYRVSVYGTVRAPSASTTQVQVLVKDGVTNLSGWSGWITTGGGWDSLYLACIIDGDGVARTLTAYANPGAVLDTSQSGSYLMVEDIGVPV